MTTTKPLPTVNARNAAVAESSPHTPELARYDLIVIGGGQGGTALAVAAAKAGKKAALIEKNAVGGSCINVGCTPSKALVAAAMRAHLARTAGDLGVHAPPRIDGPAVLDRVRRIREDARSSLRENLDDGPVELIDGEASFESESTIRIGEHTIEADRIVINTGSSPRIPDIEGLHETGFLTNENVFDLEDVPGSIILVGGGGIGCELGQAFARLGSSVCIVQHDCRLLPFAEDEVSRRLETQFEKEDVGVVLGASPIRAFRDETSGVSLELNTGETLAADRLLVAPGREPNTGPLNLGAADVDVDDKGRVLIDSDFRTSNKRVFALGDVTPRPNFTHVSYEDHRRVAAVLLNDDQSSRPDDADRSKRDLPLAWAFFTDPEVAVVGPTAEQAEERGIDAVVRDFSLDASQKAREWSEPGGHIRLIAERGTGRLVGATLIARGAAELAAALVALISQRATWRDLEQQMHIHPTYGELLPSAARRFLTDDSEA